MSEDKLKLALNMALRALRSIPHSRLDKAKRFPDQDPCCQMAYIRCAEEALHRAEGVISTIDDFLVSE